MIEDLYAATALSPFWAATLWRLRIVRRVGAKSVVELDGYSIAVGDRYLQLPPAHRIAELLHVATHVLFDHVGRMAGRDPELWWLAADAVAYSIVESTGVELPKYAKALIDAVKHLTGLDPRSASVEDIYDRLINTSAKYLIDRSQLPTYRGHFYRENYDVEEDVSRGDPALYATRPEDRRRMLIELVSSASVAAKRAGYMSLSVEKEYAKLAESAAIPWRGSLRSLFASTAAAVLETWARPNRRVEEYPGARRRTYTKVWCLVDTSGSISDEEYALFLAEVAEIARRTQSKVMFVQWEVGIRAVHEVRRPSDLEKISRIGFGGTVLAPAIRRVAELAKPWEPVVVFSDFVLWDFSAAVEALSKAAQRGKVILATTAVRPRVPGARLVQIAEPKVEELLGMSG